MAGLVLMTGAWRRKKKNKIESEDEEKRAE